MNERMKNRPGKNIFVVGLDDFSLKQLRAAPGSEAMTFHPLLSYKEAHGGAMYSAPEMMRMARGLLSEFPGKIDAILGLWDYPSSAMVPILAREFKVPGPSVQSVFKCEHKYWSRLEQSKVLPEMTPRFCRFDPFDEDPMRAVDLEYPFWVKPVKSFGSYLAFLVESEPDFRHAVDRMRDGINHFREGFEHLMGYTRIPDEIAGGGFALAEDDISTDRQCTLEGYFFRGSFHVHGLVDSITEKGVPSFNRYQYPSSIPVHAQRRMGRAAEKVLRHFGYDNAAFNIEFFWNHESGQLKILEINPRVSQSHADLFLKVDGSPNLQIPVQLALGQKPDFVAGQGEFSIAAKIFLRTFQSGRVVSAPSAGKVSMLKKRIPGAEVLLKAEPGRRLEDLRFQDSYSSVLAILFLGGSSEQDLLEKLDRSKKELDFSIEASSSSAVRKKRGRYHDGTTHSEEVFI